MCGIVGLFLKDKALEPQLGALLTDMLITMTDRGPDSAGIAIYGTDADGKSKLTVQSPNPAEDFKGLATELGTAIGTKIAQRDKDTHTVLELPADKIAEARAALKDLRPDMRVMSTGDTMEIYKEVGLPKDVAARFDLARMSGTHGIGHTRMATESAVTTMGAHPFSTGSDQCLVHNGSLSNHNSLRRQLAREGILTETMNDTEVGAAYLTWKMREGPRWAKRWKAASTTSTGSSPSSSAPRTGSAWCATPSPANRPSWPKPINMSPLAPNTGRWSTCPASRPPGSGNPNPATVYFWNH